MDLYFGKKIINSSHIGIFPLNYLFSKLMDYANFFFVFFCLI